jgi:peptide/nickel transport system substrate-binding protein
MNTERVGALVEAVSQGRISRRDFLRAAVGLGLSLPAAMGLLQACAPTPTAAPTTAPVGTSVPTKIPVATTAPTATPVPKEQKLTIAMATMPRTLDPNDIGAWALGLYDQIYNKLIRVDADNKLVPDLAASWEVIEPTVWRFHLQEGVKFHNGEVFDAEDVKYTIEFSMVPENKRLVGTIGVHQVEKVDIVDPYTIDITTKEPVGTLAGYLTRMYILPNEYFASLGAEGFDATPVGTGPFKVIDWKRDDYVNLEAYGEYWEGRPKVDKIEVRILPEPSSRVAALRAGDVNLILDTFPEFVDQLKADGFTVLSVPIGQAHLYGFGRETQRIEPLQDKRVRQAILYANDTAAIVEAVGQGLTRELDGQLAPPGATGYTPSVHAYPYDPEKARELLAEAGYADGFTMPLKSTAGKIFKDKETTEAMVSYLADVGITADVEWLESSVWAERYLNNTLDEGGMFSASLVIVPPMDVMISYIQYVCSSPRKFWCNERYDELQALQDAETDPEKRAGYLAEMTQILHDEAIMYFVFQVPYVYSWAPEVQGPEFYQNASWNLLETTIQ